jgi:ubiquitin-conjugating enzyme E2 J2
MASDLCARRLTKELAALKKEPISDPRMVVAPNESNILEIHYVIEAGSCSDSDDSPYANGIYHGKLIFPKEYPLKPPSVIMLTPSGRFVPNRRLCLSMSDFHPESWNPMWSISTILRGLYSFMITNDPTLGSINNTSDSLKRKYAAASLEYNIKHTPAFVKLFPEYLERYEHQLLLQQKNTTDATTASGDHLPSSTAMTPPVLMGIAFLQNHILPVTATMAGLVAIVSIVVAMRFL